MTKKQIKQILRIIFIIASISSLFFVPWILVRAWLAPLPDTVQEQLNEAIG
jgi:D-alanyl-D-alanine carboxypeptidase